MLFRYQAYEPLVRYNPEWTSVIPNVAESVTANDAATEFTFKLREGTRWSDGHPYTTEDVMFWYEDVFMNPEIEVTNQDHLVNGDDKAVFTKIDDFTFKVTLKSPNGLFLSLLAWADSDQTTRFPKHYLSTFLPKYNADADVQAKTAGMAGWVQMFQKKSGAALEDDFFLNSDIPVLHPWKMKVAPGESTEHAIAERNGNLPEHDPPRRSQGRSLCQQGLQGRFFACHRPAGVDRFGLCRRGIAVADGHPRGGSALQRKTGQAVHRI
jgi:peptide/nickel transport system substrate-binding protein